MKTWIKKRLAEPTTVIGLGSLIYGLGEIFKIKEALPVAEAITNAADPLAAGDYNTGIILVLSGLFGVFMREKAN